MKMRIRACFLMILMVLIVLASGAYAYMFLKTLSIENVIVPAQVKLDVVETVSDNKKTSIIIDNNSNIDVYIRVKINIYWEDTKGNTVGLPIEQSTFAYNNNDWFYDSVNDIYYYKKVVAKDSGATTNLLANNSSISLLTKTVTTTDGIDYGYNQVVEVFAEAIQAKPKDAVTQAWPVNINDGILSLKNN